MSPLPQCRSTPAEDPNILECEGLPVDLRLIIPFFLSLCFGTRIGPPLSVGFDGLFTWRYSKNCSERLVWFHLAHPHLVEKAPQSQDEVLKTTRTRNIFDSIRS